MGEKVHSYVSSARKRVADTPNHAGTKQQTSLSDISMPTALSAFQMQTLVICIPG